jgi:predicted enzyme related to lactoylglutathione lyase
MTGGILGALAGIEWLGNYAEQVQDTRYIRQLGESLARKEDIGKSDLSDIDKTAKAHLDSLIEKLEASKPGDSFLFPDGREVKTSASRHHQSLSKTTVAVFWKLTTADGQSLYIKKSRRSKNDSARKAEPTLNAVNNELCKVDFPPPKVLKVAVQLLVGDLSKARFFYEKVLGLKVEKESKLLVRCDGIVLVPLHRKKARVQPSESLAPNTTTTIYIEIESLTEVYNNVCQFGAKILKPIGEIHKRYCFTCLDPDGNEVEIIEGIPF